MHQFKLNRDIYYRMPFPELSVRLSWKKLTIKFEWQLQRVHCVGAAVLSIKTDALWRSSESILRNSLSVISNHRAGLNETGIYAGMLYGIYWNLMPMFSDSSALSVLVKQDLEQARQNVSKRIDYITQEMSQRENC